MNYIGSPVILPKARKSEYFCGHTWSAPMFHPPDANGKSVQTQVPQECTLLKGHDGPHRSATNVIIEVVKQ